jgi:hypothetical protein
MSKTVEVAESASTVPQHKSRVSLSLAIIERRRGQSVLPGTYHYEPSKGGQLKRERKGPDTKMHASQFLHFPLKNPGLLDQIREEYEYRQAVRVGNLIDTPQEARPSSEEEQLQKAFDTIETLSFIPSLKRHAEPLLNQLQCLEPYTIDLALCINQFFEWLGLNPHYFHFGPRVAGEVYGILDNQPYVIKGTRVDDLVLVTKQAPTHKQALLLEAIRKAGKGELGLSAPEVVIHCRQNAELRRLTEGLIAVEFKLGSPNQFGAVIKSHQQQATSNTGLINSALQQDSSSLLSQSPLLTMKQPKEFEPVSCQLIYFAPQDTFVTDFCADQLEVDEETLRDAITRTQLGQQLLNQNNLD